MYGVPAANLIAEGFHPLVNASNIARLGCSGPNVYRLWPSSVVEGDPALSRTTRAPAPGEL